MRNGLKRMMIAVVALLAASALAAPGSRGHFTAASYPATMHAESVLAPPTPSRSRAGAR